MTAPLLRTTSASGATGPAAPSTASSSRPASSTPLPTTPSAQPSHGEIVALQAVLEAEHAAVYGYGVVGGQVAASRRPVAAERLDWHALNRDAVAAQLSMASELAPPASPAYALPFDVDSDQAARALGAHLELAVAATYADLVAAAAAPRRSSASEAQAACAVAAQRWGTVVGAFPGLPERED